MFFSLGTYVFTFEFILNIPWFVYQRHKVWNVSVTHCLYKWKSTESDFYVYGFEQHCYPFNYPIPRPVAVGEVISKLPLYMYVVLCNPPLNLVFCKLPLYVVFCKLPLYDGFCKPPLYVLFCKPPLYGILCKLSLYNIYSVTKIQGKNR